MKDIKTRVQELQAQLSRHRRSHLKEFPTRTIFIDPMLGALGWDVRDPDEVELEYPTIDGKSVDYALKVEGKPVILLEAKALNDSLDDVRAITQVVGYAANDGIDWCVLTNGVQFKVYRSSEIAPAPEKLLFETSIDPDTDTDFEQVVSHLSRLSKTSMANGVLDTLGEEIFATAKVRKALDRLFDNQDDSFLRIIRKTMGDDNLTPNQIRSALSRIWRGEALTAPNRQFEYAQRAQRRLARVPSERPDYGEAQHTKGRPVEVVELYRALDRTCQDFAPGEITRRYLAKHVAWSLGKSVFCSVHLLQGGLKMWLKLNPMSVVSHVSFARDVSKVGHWGVGDVEFALDSIERLRQAEPFIRESFNAAAGSKPAL